MPYSYQSERPRLFTEEGQVMLLKVRDNARELLQAAGAFMGPRAWKDVSGDSWMMLACLDRLVELGELRHVTEAGATWGQHRIYAGPLNDS